MYVGWLVNHAWRATQGPKVFKWALGKWFGPVCLSGKAWVFKSSYEMPLAKKGNNGRRRSGGTRLRADNTSKLKPSVGISACGGLCHRRGHFSTAYAPAPSLPRKSMPHVDCPF